MPLTEFLKRIVGHAALASAALYFALLSLEKLIPGFVSPSVDLAQAGLATLALACVAILPSGGAPGRWRRILSAGVYFALLAVLLFFLSTRVWELGWRGYGLLAAAAFLGFAGYRALWNDEFAG